MNKEQAHEAMLRDLILQESLDQWLDRVVLAAEKTILLLEGSSGMRTNQLRNVINVANESHSVPVVVNFIRYQLGRMPQGKPWQYNGFGLQVVRDIERTLRDVADKAVEEAFHQAADAGLTLDETDRADMVQQVHRQMVPLYLGYLGRAFAFVDKTGNWAHLRQAISEASGRKGG